MKSHPTVNLISNPIRNIKKRADRTLASIKNQSSELGKEETHGLCVPYKKYIINSIPVYTCVKQGRKLFILPFLLPKNRKKAIAV